MAENQKLTKPNTALGKNIRRLIELGVLIVLFVTLTLLKDNQKVCEFFARTFSRAWILVFGNALGWIPFSLYELFLISAILGGIAFVVIAIVLLAKHKWQALLTAVLVVAISVFSFLNIYTATASFTYGRDPLPEEVYTVYSGNDFSLEEAVEFAERYIAQLNADYAATEHDADGNIVFPYTLDEMSALLAEEYKRLDSDYFSPYTPKGKWILNRTIMSSLGISGVFFAPFGEANINSYQVNFYLPRTLAHEMAHGKGVMRESEANILASYITLTSDNPYLRYGALAYHVGGVLQIVNSYPNSAKAYEELLDKIDEGIWNERDNYFSFQLQFDTLDKIGNFLNDLYLKLNKQENGVGSYYEPGESTDTGEVDDDNRPITQIGKFDGYLNLLIKLSKENKL